MQKSTGRRAFLRGLSGAAALGWASGCFGVAAPKRPRSRPNILFIMSDDHACNTIGAYGSRLVKTPHIDRIAREGALLVNSFCANSICSPSRACILTGTHNHKNGVTYNGATWDGRQTVYSRLLQKAGYQTALIGKWHQKPPTPTDEVGYWDVLIGHGGQGSYHDPVFATSGGQSQCKGYATDLIASKAIAWMEGQWNRRDPFLLMAQFKAPHVPRQPPPRHFERYDPESIPLPPTFFDDYKGRAPYAAKAWMKVWDGRPAKPETYPLPASPQERKAWADLGEQERAWKEHEDRRNADYHKLLRAGTFNDTRVFATYLYRRRMQDYLGCVSAVDDNVGRLLAWLDKQGLAEDTIVVYCSDQSYFIGEHGWMEKRWMYEESLRMPFMLRWPGTVKPGTRIEAMVQNIDFAPTFLDAAGEKVPAEMQGRSFLGLLQGRPADDWRDAIYYHYYHHGAHNVPRHDGVRTARYKLIHYYTDDVYELFDLKNDPHELKSIHDAPQSADVVRDMRTRLAELRKLYEVPEKVYRYPYVYLSQAERKARAGKR